MSQKNYRDISRKFIFFIKLPDIGVNLAQFCKRIKYVENFNIVVKFSIIFRTI
jgi:hypothetical protein